MKDKKKSIIQFIKFGIVGFINTFCSYIISNCGYYIFNLHEQICNLIAFIITVFISYILNGNFVFNDNKENRSYVLYSFTGLFLSAVLLYVEESIFGIPHYIATLINLVITIPLNFILNKFWAFKN